MSDDKPSPSEKVNNTSTEEDSSDDETSMDSLLKYFAQRLHLGHFLESEPETKVIDDLTVNGITNHWKENGFKNIVTMVGAGVSTSAGIPDFRTPGSGLYNNLRKYNLPHPEAIFDIEFFRNTPEPFFELAKELLPIKRKPTPAHYFVRLLHEKGLLLRHYTQNIDILERIAEIPDEKLVEAHGTFYTSTCMKCYKHYSLEWIKNKVFSDLVPKCERCEGVVKPDIVFFHENLPERFYELQHQDLAKCDLLIIMGTSLVVQPFANLVTMVKPNCLRLLINREKVGQGLGLKFKESENKRDVAYLGDCDAGVRVIAECMSWKDELESLIQTEHARIDKEFEAESENKKKKSVEEEKDADEKKEKDEKDEKTVDKNKKE